VHAETAVRAWPPVSVVMPVLDEERHLRAAVSRVLSQSYPGEVEVVLALGPSRDRTEEIARELARADPRVRLVSNPSGRTPAGLNAALAMARHGIVARLDGHALPPPDYLQTAVDLLAETGADNVGGVMAAVGETPFEQAVARAMRSRVGVGNAAFHTGGTAGPAQSVYLGVFRREMLERLGGYDETFARAQDWELNYRIRQAGGLVWFSPRLEVCYRPRSSLRALASQYLHYGRWRRAISRRHPGSISLRYLAPPAALATVVGGTLLAALGKPVGLVLPSGYAVAVVLGAVWTGRGLPPGAQVRLPLVYATMHLAWATGFLTSPAGLTAAAPPTPVPGAVYAVDEFPSSP
jgi:succinoglycan biosynthesis protein ExoA